MKMVLKYFSIVMMVLLLICVLPACTESENNNPMDVTITFLETPYEEFNPSQDVSADEVIFLIRDIPEDRVFTEGDYEYILDMNEEYAAIISYTGSDTEVTVPKKLGRKQVIAITSIMVSDTTELADGTIAESSLILHPFEHLSSLKKVKFADTIIHLNGGFWQCPNISEVILPKYLHTIGKMTFYGCEKIEHIALPDFLKEIHNMAFARCSALQEISFPDSLEVIRSAAFEDCISLRKIEIHKESCVLERSVFSGCTELESVVITGVETLSSFMFYECINLEEVILGDGLQTIEYGAFMGCENLETIEIPASVTAIGESAFEKCSSLKEIDIPQYVTEIRINTFADCTDLKNITLCQDTICNEFAFGEETSTLPNITLYVKNDAVIEPDPATGTNPEIKLEPEPEPPVVYPTPVEDLGAYEFRFFDIASSDASYFPIYTVENRGEQLNEAVTVRNQKVSELYNCTITELVSNDYYYDFRIGVLAGVNWCDLAMFSDEAVMRSATEGILGPWKQTAAVDLKQSWWDQAANSRYRLNGVQLALNGAFNLNNYQGRMCYAYNRTLLESRSYSWGMDEYNYADNLFSNATSGWGEDGVLSVAGDRDNLYTHSGGINGSAYDYYRTMMAGCGVDFYNLTEENMLELSFGTGNNFIGLMDGMPEDEVLRSFRKILANSYLEPEKEIALLDIQMIMIGQGLNPDGMEEFMACDATRFTDGKSTFKIVRLDEIPALRETGMDIGIVPLPGGENASLVDRPTFAVQPIGTSKETEHRTLVLLDALACYSQEEVIPAFTESIIGPYNPADQRTTGARNAEMLKQIYSDPYYELYGGDSDRELKYMYYKYYLRYNSADLWWKGQITQEEFGKAVRMQNLQLEKFNQSLAYYLEAHYEPEPIQLTENISVLIDKEHLTVSGTGEIPCMKDLLEDIADVEQFIHVVVEDGITALGEEAFYDFENVTQITLPDSVTEIKAGALQACSAIETLVLPANLTFIGSHAFRGCGGISSLVLPDSVTVIDSYAFSSTCIEELVWPSVVTEVGDGMFASSQIKTIVIPEGVTVIGDSAFAESKLTDISLPSTLKTIGKEAFRESDLTSIVIPDGVVSIGEEAFLGCDKLKDAVIPASVTTIGKRAFLECYALETIAFLAQVEVIGEEMFQYCSALKRFDIPDGVREIKESAFRLCKSLETVVFPEGLEIIEMQVFEECTNLREAILPDSVTKVEYAAFYECKSLEKIALSAGMTVMSNCVLDGCSSLTEIVIPEQVTFIDYFAFSDCTSLKKVTIPASIEMIEGNAFSDCPLEEVYYGGTQADWDQIKIDSSNENLKNAARYFE